MTIVLGTHVHPATGAAERRQQNGLQSLRSLRNVVLMNLQFHDRVNLRSADGFETCPVLRQDSQIVSGRDGVRKPIVSEMFQRLAEHARGQDCRYFGFVNSDILVGQEAIELACGGGKQATIFSRMDFDGPTGRDLGMLIYGADLFIVDAQWWLIRRRLFRSYVVGESCWDNVYAAQLLCHADAVLLNRRPLIRHERHEGAWRDSPFAGYNHFLAALDACYFSHWARYIHHLTELRTQSADPDEEMDWQTQAFRWRPTLKSRTLQACRSAKVRLRSLILGLRFALGSCERET